MTLRGLGGQSLHLLISWLQQVGKFKLPTALVAKPKITNLAQHTPRSGPLLASRVLDPRYIGTLSPRLHLLTLITLKEITGLAMTILTLGATWRKRHFLTHPRRCILPPQPPLTPGRRRRALTMVVNLILQDG